jgi:hypothetical protein
MTPEMRDAALRLRAVFTSLGAPDINVGVGSTARGDVKVPALYVYCTDAELDRIKLPTLFDFFEEHPVVWSVGAERFTAGPATDQTSEPDPKPEAKTSSTTRGSYILAIDTDTYSGNFERELTAYCTGQIGECEVGDRERKLFVEDCGGEVEAAFADIVERRGDEHGCYRPCSIWQPPRYHSVAIFFAKRPGPDLIDLIQARAREYGRGISYGGRRFSVLGFRLIYEEVVTRQVEEAL